MNGVDLGPKHGNVVIDSLKHKFHETRIEKNDNTEDCLLCSIEEMFNCGDYSTIETINETSIVVEDDDEEEEINDLETESIINRLHKHELIDVFKRGSTELTKNNILSTRRRIKKAIRKSIQLFHLCQFTSEQFTL